MDTVATIDAATATLKAIRPGPGWLDRYAAARKAATRDVAAAALTAAVAAGYAPPGVVCAACQCRLHAANSTCPGPEGAGTIPEWGRFLADTADTHSCPSCEGIGGFCGGCGCAGAYHWHRPGLHPTLDPALSWMRYGA